MRELNARMYRSALKPAQWSALRYFGRAAARQRTLTDFARFHATTLGTASQTLSTLQRKGLIARSASPTDRRRADVQLTRKGRALLKQDPLDIVRGHLQQLPAPQRLAFAVMMKDLLFRLYAER
ncbi:MAG TPA: MarR family transcriptional regulator [Thalassobaculum sp.]